MTIAQDLALGQLHKDGGRWWRSVKQLRAAAAGISDRTWRAHYIAAAMQIRRWRRQALQRRRAHKNPLSKRAAAVIRREILRHAGDGRPQRVAVDLAYRYARSKGLVE
jgi:CO/xanthine dehydrogenase FAD-binding subunit